MLITLPFEGQLKASLFFICSYSWPGLIAQVLFDDSTDFFLPPTPPPPQNTTKEI